MSQTDKRPEHVGRTVRKAIDIRAPAHDVYEAWADPDAIARWFVDRAEGRMTSGSTVTWIFEAFGMRMPVPVVVARPDEEIVIAGEIPGRLPFMQEIQLEHRGGVTHLRLANSGFAEGAEWDEEFRGVDSGWEMALATLQHQLEHHPGRTRVRLFSMRSASFDFARAATLFATAEGLQGWMCDDAGLDGPELRTGAPIRLRLGDLGTLDGRVLAWTGREALLSWPARHGVLGLKCFQQGPLRAVALDVSLWREPHDRAALERFLERALDRLVEALG